MASEKDPKLERKILRFTKKSEENLETNPKLGIRYLHQANKLYNIYNPPEKDFKIISEVSQMISKYGNKFLN